VGLLDVRWVLGSYQAQPVGVAVARRCWQSFAIGSSCDQVNKLQCPAAAVP
jgi:hypothetical protein